MDWSLFLLACRFNRKFFGGAEGPTVLLLKDAFPHHPGTKWKVLCQGFHLPFLGIFRMSKDWSVQTFPRSVYFLAISIARAMHAARFFLLFCKNLCRKRSWWRLIFIQIDSICWPFVKGQVESEIHRLSLPWCVGGYIWARVLCCVPMKAWGYICRKRDFC